jgi:DNA-binding transcriptional regulator GbsR (MarR family)
MDKFQTSAKSWKLNQKVNNLERSIINVIETRIKKFQLKKKIRVKGFTKEVYQTSSDLWFLKISQRKKERKRKLKENKKRNRKILPPTPPKNPLQYLYHKNTQTTKMKTQAHTPYKHRFKML